MSQDTNDTPEPELQAPDLSMVSIEDLVGELKNRSPDAFILHMEHTEDAGREKFYRRFSGDWARLVGIAGDMASYCRGRVRRLYPRPEDPDDE